MASDTVDLPSSDAQSAAGAEQTGLARLYGEPLLEVPQDLYIPPDALEVILEAFEGPLDLLLYLIRKQNFNVLDIPMADLTRQYLGYVEQIRQHNFELASDYLLMAATLIEIKSRMLLPVKDADTGEEPEDPRAELVRRLLEYEQMKIAARLLDEMPRMGRDFVLAHAEPDVTGEPILPQVDVDDLRAAWEDILKRARLNRSHAITQEQLTVRDAMSSMLQHLGQVRYVEFNDLFSPMLEAGEPPMVLVVHFIAMLELARESLLQITQAEPYAPIYVYQTHNNAS